MNEPRMRDDLNDVLDAYVASVSTPTYDALREWTRRYPQYAAELTAFTASWSAMETLPQSPEAQALTDRELVDRGLASVRGLLARPATPATAATTATFAGLAAAGQAQGLSIGQIAERSGLSLVLLRMLDRRLIRFASIPRQAIEALAEMIGREAGAVATYLQGAPTLASGASYYSEQKPELAAQEDFFDAVRDDPDLDDEARERWLALEADGNQGGQGRA